MILRLFKTGKVGFFPSPFNRITKQGFSLGQIIRGEYIIFLKIFSILLSIKNTPEFFYSGVYRLLNQVMVVLVEECFYRDYYVPALPNLKVYLQLD